MSQAARGLRTLNAVYTLLVSLAATFMLNDTFGWWKSPHIYTQAIPAQMAYGIVIGGYLTQVFLNRRRLREMRRYRP